MIKLAEDDDDIQKHVNVRRFIRRVEQINNLVRNDTLEEVAKEFDKMLALGDTASSFARFVRDMKK